MTWTTSSVIDALIQVDDAPTWIRVSAVESLTPTHTGRTEIRMASGQSIITTTSVLDVIDKMNAALRR